MNLADFINQGFGINRQRTAGARRSNLMRSLERTRGYVRTGPRTLSAMRRDGATGS